MRAIIEMAREAELLPLLDEDCFQVMGTKNFDATKRVLERFAALVREEAQRKPLTDKQILADETLRYYFGLNGGAGPVSKQGRKIVNAIEAAHGIKGAA